jgi:hypothetical protein
MGICNATKIFLAALTPGCGRVDIGPQPVWDRLVMTTLSIIIYLNMMCNTDIIDQKEKRERRSLFSLDYFNSPPAGGVGAPFEYCFSHSPSCIDSW